MAKNFKKILLFLILIFPVFFAYPTEPEKEYLLLITGCGRSGTKYIATLLKDYGINIDWENLGKDGISSWTMGVDCDQSPSGPPFKGLAFKHTFHQVRHPLDVISSWYYNEMQESFLWDDFICKHIPQINKDEPFLARCAKYWYYWNLEASKKAEFRYKVEDIDSDLLDEMAKRLEIKTPLNKKAISNTSKKTNSWLPVESKLKWADLKNVLSKEEFAKIRVLARQYGYSNQDVESIKIATKEDAETIFTEIYDTCAWGKNSKENIGSSGPGSTIARAKPYIDFLSTFIKSNNIKSVVDIGCGDWASTQYIDWKNIQYVGVDIVKSVIERNKKKFSKENIKFIHKDFLKESIPSGDLIICKDLLQHLPNEDVLHFLKKIKQYKYCLITNNVHPKTLSSNNTQIKMGAYRFLDLTKSPFNVTGVKVFSYSSGNALKQVLFIDNSNKLSK